MYEAAGFEKIVLMICEKAASALREIVLLVTICDLLRFCYW